MRLDVVIAKSQRNFSYILLIHTCAIPICHSPSIKLICSLSLTPVFPTLYCGGYQQLVTRILLFVAPVIAHLLREPTSKLLYCHWIVNLPHEGSKSPSEHSMYMKYAI